MNCTEAYSSAYAKVGRVPVAVLGLMFFAGLFLLQVSARTLGVPDPAHVGVYAFALGVPGVAFAAYLAAASWFVLHVVCLLCVTIDVATLGVCVIGGLMTRFSLASVPARLARDLKALGARPAAVGPRPWRSSARRLALIGVFPRAAAEPVFAADGVPPSSRRRRRPPSRCRRTTS